MALNDYYKNYLDQIMETVGPNMKKQQEAMYDYLMQLGQRQGHAGAMRDAAKAVAPYAEESGAAAAKAGTEATRLAQQQEQYAKQLDLYNRQLAERQREWDEKMAAWEKEFTYQQTQDKTKNQLSMFSNTGWTPEMMEAMGYGDYTRDAFGATGYKWGSQPTNAPQPGYTGAYGSSYYRDGVKYGYNHPAAYK